MLDTRGPFEPILWLLKSARTTVVSETRETDRIQEVWALDEYGFGNYTE